MDINAVFVYFLGVAVFVGIGVALYFRYSYAIADLESKITGIWTNESKTLRILIYSLESRFRAEVVWTRNSEVRLLGSDVIRNLTLKLFGGGQGVYIDPFTKHQFDLKLKYRNAGRLDFHLMEKSSQGQKKVEAWRQVK